MHDIINIAFPKSISTWAVLADLTLRITGMFILPSYALIPITKARIRFSPKKYTEINILRNILTPNICSLTPAEAGKIETVGESRFRITFCLTGIKEIK